MDECPLYSDPALYDSLFPNARDSASVTDDARRQRTVASERFYLDEARRSGGPVLELGCGSGRLTVPIAQSGIEIIGADVSAPMLEAARAKARAAGVEVPFLEADMRSFELHRRFAAIFIPGNSLLHLVTIQDLKQCLGSVRRQLVDGGRLVFDVSKWDLTPQPRHPLLNVSEIAIEETSSYDSADQIRNVTWHLSSPGAPDYRVISFALRVIFPQELLLLLEATGFKLDTRYGEFTREPFESSSPRQVCICSR